MILSIQSEPKLGRSEEYLHVEIGGSSLADTLYKEVLCLREVFFLVGDTQKSLWSSSLVS